MLSKTNLIKLENIQNKIHFYKNGMFNIMDQIKEIRESSEYSLISECTERDIDKLKNIEKELSHTVGDFIRIFELISEFTYDSSSY